MSSLSFDPIAPVYDATRGYPELVAQKIALGIEKASRATTHSSFLEVGIGTGRIAFPLAALGHTYTGVDISPKMVELLEEKLCADQWRTYERAWGVLPDEDSARPSPVHRFVDPRRHASMRLVMSDMTALPFHDASFDIVIAVHVFHLVDGWQRAVEEVLRVLRPGGVFIHGWDEYVISDVRRVEEEWPRILRSLGGSVNRPGTSSRLMISNFLHEKGFQLEEYVLAEWESVVTPRQAVEYVTKRIWSGTLNIPEDIFTQSTQRLWEWATSYYGEQLDTTYRQGRRFVISRMRR